MELTTELSPAPGRVEDLLDRHRTIGDHEAMSAFRDEVGRVVGLLDVAGPLLPETSREREMVDEAYERLIGLLSRSRRRPVA